MGLLHGLLTQGPSMRFFFMRWETSTHGEVEQLEAPVLQPRSHGKMVAPWDVIMILGKPALG